MKNYDYYLGKMKQSYNGYAVDMSVREMAVSGRMVSSILIYLLEKSGN